MMGHVYPDLHFSYGYTKDCTWYIATDVVPNPGEDRSPVSSNITGHSLSEAT